MIRKFCSTFFEILISYPGTKVKIKRLSSMDHIIKYIISLTVFYFSSGQQVRNPTLKDQGARKSIHVQNCKNKTML